jgi:hypothetical protein
MEIAREAKVEIIDLENVDGLVEQSMLERLFDTMLRSDEGGGGSGGSGGEGESNSFVGKSQNLVLVWEQIIIYRSNSKIIAAKQAQLEGLVSYLSVLLICMLAVKTYILARSISHPASTIFFNFPLLFLPIFISVLVGITNRLQYALKTKILTAGAEILLSEIYSYRTATGMYVERADERIGKALLKVVEMVTSTVVGEMSLSRAKLEQIRLGWFAVSPEDDGFSPLSPDSYIRQRLCVNLKMNSTKTLNLAEFFFKARVATFLFGATGTILAGANMSIFVAVAVAFSVATQSAIEKRSPMVCLKSQNRCIGDLVNAKAWWEARTQIEQANPLKFSELVRTTEASLMTLLRSTNPAAGSLSTEEDVSAQLDVNGFIADILSNTDDGKIVFGSKWMDKYASFFQAYNEWYGVKENLQQCTIVTSVVPVNVKTKPKRFLPSITNVTDELLSGHEKIEILWNPDEFLLRNSTAVMMAAPLITTSVKDVAKLLKLNTWMAKNSGKSLPPSGKKPAIRGVVSIIGASTKLDDYFTNGKDGEGNSLPDRLSGEESMARLRMVFSRGIIGAAHNADAVVITSGYDVGPAGYTGVASRDRNYRVPVVGVVSKAHSSWPGDERPGQLERIPLNPDHTHL